ncbi:MAG: glutathione-disulfide reductase [Pseudomonadota bacterium]
MSDWDYDIFVIGAGSGGVRAARMAAGFGARVAIAEDRYLGGTCVNVGCVPKKLYVYASEYGKGFDDAREFGWSTGERRFDWPTLRDNKKSEISRLNGIYRSLLQGVDANLIDGRARIIDPHTVAVGDGEYRCERILIATGGWPYIPDFPGNHLTRSSNEIFDLEEFPERLLIIGGGYIAVEFAGIFNGLGSKVTQLYRGPLFLRGFDEDVRRHAAQEIPKTGVDLRFDTNIIKLEEVEEGLRATLTSGDVLEVDAVLCAAGRRPHLEGLGIENTGVALDDKGFIEVDSQYQTAEPSVYALGDVIGGLELTPVALAEGMALARRLYGDLDRPVEYDFIATAVFCQPNIGTVGFTEAAAREKFGSITLYKSDFRPMKHTISGRDERTFMKLIVDDATDRVVGLHMMGPEAGEIVQGMAIALKAGATKAMFDATIGIHPTAAEEFVTMREPWTG